MPARYVCLWLCPAQSLQQVNEARALGAVLCDVVFRQVAALADDAAQLVHALIDYMEQGTVLPPSHWDSRATVEPTQMPDTRQRQLAQALREAGNEDAVYRKKSSLQGHGADPALQFTGRLFGGLVADIKRRGPRYVSDFTDALNPQCLATFFFMYFALLAPIVTFGGLLEESTGQRMAAMENILAGAICGTLYCLFAGQPLTIICPTGPVLIFEQVVFQMCL